MPGQRFVAQAGLQILPQSDGEALLVYEKALAGGFQEMDGHGFGLAQMLSVGHGFVCFISDIGFKIFPVCTCVKELLPAAQDFLLRHRHPDLIMVFLTLFPL